MWHTQDELKAELAELEQDELNERLMGADHVPIHTPAGAQRAPGASPRFRLEHILADMLALLASRTAMAEEDDEEAELKALQASLAM